MINKIVLELLNKRGIVGDKNVSEFLSPRPLLTYDPFLLLGMKEGVDLIVSTIKEKKKICIYGDYDADGVTSVSILMEVLSTLTDNLTYYVPSRFGEGYGLNKEAVKKIADGGTDLIITVDCGIVSFDEVDYAKELGMDIIVTDHHSVGEKLPNCIVINPKQKDCAYPFKELAGCGVAFKLAQGLQKTLGFPKAVINRVLDLVALGTIGDIVPLVDENRTIVKYGMNEIMSGRRDGLRKLNDQILKNRTNISSEDISFSIVPHLNAAGRMESARIGIELFTSKENESQNVGVEKLIILNKERKRVQEATFKKCIDSYEANYSEFAFPIIKMDDAHEGITGIVAGKMKEYCNKPVAILTKDGDFYKGTSRGTDSVDIYRVLNSQSELFTKFGGHSGACGFSLPEIHIEALQRGVEESMSSMDICESERENFDMILKGEELSLELVRAIEELAPFGCENERPIFKIENCIVKNKKTMGADGNHLRFDAMVDGLGTLNCVCFNYEFTIDRELEDGDIVDIIGKLEINSWNNNDKLQLLINSVI